MPKRTDLPEVTWRAMKKLHAEWPDLITSSHFSRQEIATAADVTVHEAQRGLNKLKSWRYVEARKGHTGRMNYRLTEKGKQATWVAAGST